MTSIDHRKRIFLNNSGSEGATDSPVWTEEDLRREEVRGLFVFGVLATILGYYSASKSSLSSFFGEAPPLSGLIVNIVSTLFLTFWGFYVVATVFSMMDWGAKGRYATVLRGLKQLGRMMFLLGVFESLVFVAFLGPISLYIALADNPTSWTALTVVLFVAAGALFVLARVRYKKQQHNN